MKIINIIAIIITVIVSVACSSNEEVVVDKEHVSGVEIIYAKNSVTEYFVGLGIEDIESMEYVPYTEDNLIYKNELDISGNTPENVIVISVDLVNSQQTRQMVVLDKNNEIKSANKWEVVNVSQVSKSGE